MIYAIREAVRIIAEEGLEARFARHRLNHRALVAGVEAMGLSLLVPEKERLLFQAWKAHMDGHNDEAHRLYAQAAERFPEDKEALYLAGDLYLHEGDYAEALPRFQQALRLDPVWEPALMHLTDCLDALGRLPELLEKSRWWVEKAPGGSAYRALARALSGAGRWGESVEAARRAFDVDGGTIFSRVTLAEALLLVERYAEAEALLRPLSGPETLESDRQKALPVLAAAVAYQGRRHESLQLVEGLPPPTPSHKGAGAPLLRLQHLLGERGPDAALAEARAQAAAGDPSPRLAAVLALAGDAALAAAQLPGLPASPEKELAEAAIAFRRGDASATRTRLAELARRPNLDMRALAAWMQARAALEAHRDPEAIEALERLRTLPGGLWRSWAYPRSFYLEAAAAERLGDRARARQRIDHLLALWKQPDADLPYLAEARALRRRLAAAPAP
jgi:tetratricopeptide (TPR) repeat protein